MPPVWTPIEADAARRLAALALLEDFGPGGDLTGQSFVPPHLSGAAALVARRPGVVAGLPLVPIVCGMVSAHLTVELVALDGDRVAPGQRFAVVRGPERDILAAERTFLNFVQRLSGVATLTADYVGRVAGTKAGVFDTRKTTPGWRALEKYAVRCGGGKNHRMGLWDMALVKDNHLAALPDATRWADLAKMLAQFRERHPGVPVEVEVDSLEQLAEVLPLRPEIVLLDNMSPAMMRQAVQMRDRLAPGVELEASGNINLETIAAAAACGVDRISVGALTHSAPALDVGLDHLPAEPEA